MCPITVQLPLTSAVKEPGKTINLPPNPLHFAERAQTATSKLPDRSR